MAWIINGFIHPGQVFNGKKWVDLYGPLPARLWVKSPSDKRHRVARPSRLVAKPAHTRQAYITQAILYCAWLAQRDGVAISPSAYGRPVWEFPDRKARGRIRAVQFGETRIDIPNWDFEPREPIEEREIPGAGLERWLNEALAVAA